MYVALKTRCAAPVVDTQTGLTEALLCIRDLIAD